MRHLTSGLIIAVAILGAFSCSRANPSQPLARPLVSTQAPFSVTVVPEASDDRGLWLSMTKTSQYAKPFHVVLTNTTNEPQRVFESWNGWGYKAISFELVTTDGQKVVLSRKDQDFDKNFPSTFTVLPGEHYVYTIQLTDEDWDVVPEIKFDKIEPLSVHLKVVYGLKPTRSAQSEKVWIGRVESKSYECRLFHD
jgi:hypothetical protein